VKTSTGLPSSKKLWRCFVYIETIDGWVWSPSFLLGLEQANALAQEFKRDGRQARVEEDSLAVTEYWAAYERKKEELAEARKRAASK